MPPKRIIGEPVKPSLSVNSKIGVATRSMRKSDSIAGVQKTSDDAYADSFQSKRLKMERTTPQAAAASRPATHGQASTASLPASVPPLTFEGEVIKSPKAKLLKDPDVPVYNLEIWRAGLKRIKEFEPKKRISEFRHTVHSISDDLRDTTRACWVGNLAFTLREAPYNYAPPCYSSESLEHPLSSDVVSFRYIHCFSSDPDHPEAEPEQTYENAALCLRLDCRADSTVVGGEFLQVHAVPGFTGTKLVQYALDICNAFEVPHLILHDQAQKTLTFRDRKNKEINAAISLHIILPLAASKDDFAKARASNLPLTWYGKSGFTLLPIAEPGLEANKKAGKQTILLTQDTSTYWESLELLRNTSCSEIQTILTQTSMNRPKEWAALLVRHGIANPETVTLSTLIQVMHTTVRNDKASQAARADACRDLAWFQNKLLAESLNSYAVKSQFPHIAKASDVVCGYYLFERDCRE